LSFKDSGIDVTVRYFTIATKRNQISTDIRREIFHQIRNTKDVEIAYPHTEVLFREK
jgi:small-conductance mechanosensitive channel